MKFTALVKSSIALLLATAFISSDINAGGGYGNKGNTFEDKKHPNRYRKNGYQRRYKDKTNGHRCHTNTANGKQHFIDADKNKKAETPLLKPYHPPLLSQLSELEYSDLIRRANMDDRVAQDEIVTRYFWGQIPLFHRSHIIPEAWTSFDLVKKGLVEQIDFDLYAHFIVFVYHDVIYTPIPRERIIDEYALFWKILTNRTQKPLVQFILGKGRLLSPFLDKHKPEGLAWLSIAANQGFPLAQNVLEEEHLNDNPVPKDFTKAMTYFDNRAKETYSKLLTPPKPLSDESSDEEVNLGPYTVNELLNDFKNPGYNISIFSKDSE